MAFGRLVSKATDEEFAAQIGDYLDLDDFARYVFSHGSPTTTACSRTARTSTYLPPDARTGYAFIAWDRTSRSATGVSNSGLSIHAPWNGNNRFLSRVFAVEAFRSKYRPAWPSSLGSLFLPDRFAQQVAEIGPAIRSSIELEGKEWLPRLRQVVAAGKSASCPTSPTGPRSSGRNSQKQRANLSGITGKVESGK